MEKENMPTPEKIRLARSATQKMRTPLQELNIPRATGSLKKTQYYPITPNASPLLTPPRRLKNAHLNLGYQSPSQVCLNALIYKKLDLILEEKNKEHKSELHAKDAEIARLQEKLKAEKLVQKNVAIPAVKDPRMTYEDIDEISQFVENILESASLECHEDGGDQMFRTKSLCDVATSPISCSGSADSHLFESCSKCNINRAFSTGALDTTPMKSVIGVCDKAVSTSPFMQKTPIKKKQTCSRGVTTSPTSATSPNYAELLLDKSVGTPIKALEKEILTSPIQLLDILSIDAENDTSDLVRLEHAETNTIAVKILSTDVHEVDTQTDSVTPKNFLEVNTQTDAPTANETQEVDTQTDFEMVTQATSMTPLKTNCTETCTTPGVSSHAEVAVGTSPLFQALPRFSELRLTGVPPSELASQLETATISNTLLRDELSSLVTRKESLEHHLQTALDGNKNEESKIQSIRLNAQAALQRELQEVLEQQSIQLNQIAELQAELSSVKSKAETDLEKQAKIQQRLKEDNHNLQEDLNRAYKQYKQELSSLKENNVRNTYKPYYEEAQQKVLELQAQVDAFTELANAVQEFEVSQLETHNFLEEGFKQLEFKTRQHAEQYRQWEDQYETWMQESADKDVILNETTIARDELQQQVTLLEKELMACKDRLSKVQSAHEETSVELVHSSDQVVDLLEEKHNLSRKLESTEKALEECQLQLDEVDQTLDETKAKVSRLQQQVADLQQKLENARAQNAVTAEVESELQTTRQQLKAALQLQSMSREQEEFQESELEVQREELAEVQAHLEETRQQLAEERLVSEGRSNDIQWLNRSNKDLGDRIQELENQLDHTKSQAHNLLMSQNSEITTSLVGLGQMGEVLSALQTTLVSQLSVWAALIEKQKEMKAERMAEMKLTQSQVLARQREVMSEEEIQAEVTLIEDLEHEEEVTTSEEGQKDSEPNGDWFSPTKAADGMTPAKSFLSQILCALEGVASPLKFAEDFDDEVIVESEENANECVQNADNHDREQDVDSASLKDAEDTHLADFDQHNTDSTSETCESSGLRLKAEGSAFVRVIKNREKYVSTSETASTTDDDDDVSSEDSANQKLNDVTKALVDQVYAITQAFRELYKMVGESSCHGEAYREELEGALERERVMHRRYLVCHTDKLQDLQAQLVICQKNETCLQQRLNETSKAKEEFELQLQETREQFSKFSIDMHNLAQRESYKVLEKEIMNLQEVLQNKEADLAALQESLDSTISRFSGHHSDMSSILRESAVLRKEVNRLRTKHLRFRDDSEKVESRLRKKVKVLEDNWHKAEKELQFVDHLVDKIKKMLQGHSEVMEWPEHQLLRDLGLFEYTVNITHGAAAANGASPKSIEDQDLHLGTPV